MNPLLSAFIAESREMLSEIEQCMALLEQPDAARETVDRLFRAVHTIKGNSGLFDLAPVLRATHLAETVLVLAKSGELAPGQGVRADLYRAFDLVAGWIDRLDADGALPAGAAAEVDGLAARMAAYLPQEQAQARPQVVDAAVAAGWLDGFDAAACRAAFAAACAARREQVVVAQYRPEPGCFFSGEDPLYLARTVPALSGLALALNGAAAAPDADPFACGLELTLLSSATATEVADGLIEASGQVRLAELPLQRLIRLPREPLADAPLAALIDALRRSDEAGCRALLAAPDPASAALRWARPWLELLVAIDATRWVLPLLIALQHGRAECDPPAAPGRDRAAVAGLLAHQLRLLRSAQAAAALPSARQVARQCALRLGAPERLAEFEAPAGDGPAAAEALAAAIERLLALARPAPPSPPPAALPEAARPTQALRVSEHDLDAAVGLLDELMAARNALAGLPAVAAEPQLKAQVQLLGKRVDELFAALRGMRMVSLQMAFQRLRRLVRGLGETLGKPIDFQVEGEDTVADKAIVDAVYDPLVHLIRNAIDHGVEPPEARRALGKPAAARVTVRAALDEEQTLRIEVGDDGGGIDVERVRRRARECGLLGETERLDDAEAVQLIFHPGFSTAEAVSDISGRGVGMDVVRSVLRRLGGEIAVHSRPGEGTVFALRLPLSLTLSRLLNVRCGGQWFALPVGQVEETLRLPRERLRRIKHAETLLWRGEVLPVLRLDAALGLPAPPRGDTLCLVLLRLPVGRCLLEVDALGEPVEAVVRPLEGVLAPMRAYAGSVLSADGEVRLVLNPKELIAT